MLSFCVSSSPFPFRFSIVHAVRVSLSLIQRPVKPGPI